MSRDLTVYTQTEAAMTPRALVEALRGRGFAVEWRPRRPDQPELPTGTLTLEGSGDPGHHLSLSHTPVSEREREQLISVFGSTVPAPQRKRLETTPAGYSLSMASSADARGQALLATTADLLVGDDGVVADWSDNTLTDGPTFRSSHRHHLRPPTDRAR